MLRRSRVVRIVVPSLAIASSAAQGACETPRNGGGCDGNVKRMDWDAAMALRVPGDDGWRLPTKDELDTIVEWNCKKPAIDEEVFPDTALMTYWSSTPSGRLAYQLPVGNFRRQYLRSNQQAVRFVRDGR